MTLSPRAKLLALAALFAAPIAASFFAYYVVKPQPTGNYGELLPPRPAPAALRELEGRWLLVAADRAPCAEACRAKLDTTARIRLALGRNAARVQRVLLVDDPAAIPAELSADGLKVVRLPGSAGDAAGDPAHFHLVDPRGNLMMRWPAQPDAKRMLKDLERLLKASQIG